MAKDLRTIRNRSSPGRIDGHIHVPYQPHHTYTPTALNNHYLIGHRRDWHYYRSYRHTFIPTRLLHPIGEMMCFTKLFLLEIYFIIDIVYSSFIYILSIITIIVLFKSVDFLNLNIFSLHLFKDYSYTFQGLYLRLSAKASRHQFYFFAD